MDVSLTEVFHGRKAVAEALLEHGQGRVINMSSEVGGGLPRCDAGVPLVAIAGDTRHTPG